MSPGFERFPDPPNFQAAAGEAPRTEAGRNFLASPDKAPLESWVLAIEREAAAAPEGLPLDRIAAAIQSLGSFDGRHLNSYDRARLIVDADAHLSPSSGESGGSIADEPDEVYSDDSSE